MPHLEFWLALPPLTGTTQQRFSKSKVALYLSVLRFTQGFLEIAGTGTAVWPTAGTIDGSLPASFWFDGVLAPVVIAPLLEEFFFRAVLLVAIFTAVRRMTNSRSCRKAWKSVASIRNTPRTVPANSSATETCS